MCKGSLSNSTYYAHKLDGSHCIVIAKLSISGPNTAKVVRLVATRHRQWHL